MSAPQIEFASPVDWPAGRPKEGGYEVARFRFGDRHLLFDDAVRRLREQCEMVTKPGHNYRMREMTLSTNFELRADGRPRRDRGAPADPAVAFFFELDRVAHVLACDRWNTVADNIAAIAAHIEALRGQERWGVSDMKQAFAGHVALPAPEQWWQVLGCREDTPIEQIEAVHRKLAKKFHPDAGGSTADMARINAALDQARQSRRQAA